MEQKIEVETVSLALLKIHTASLQRRTKGLASACADNASADTILAWLDTARLAVAGIATCLNELASVWEPNGTPSGEDGGE